ncbi:MAG: SDR family oxidoreductase [Chitinophagales bacterium]
METKNKYVLITGGTSGIGYELAEQFAQNGYHLILVARGKEALLRAATAIREAYGVEVMEISKDLFLPEAAQELYNEVKQRGLQVEILVNDAGQGLYGEFLYTDMRRELEIIQLNIASLVVLTKLFSKEMVAAGGGKILNVASIAGKVPGPLQSVYHGTKAFVHSFTEAIRIELKDKNVTVTSLLPGATNTDFFRKANMLQSKVVQDGELADPKEVARDGYEGLMNDKDMVVSGFKNKMQVAMSNMTPDAMAAAQMYEQQKPVENKIPQRGNQ